MFCVLLTILSLVLFVLKLAGVIAISWWLVFAPVALAFLIVLVCFIAVAVVSITLLDAVSRPFRRR